MNAMKSEKKKQKKQKKKKKTYHITEQHVLSTTPFQSVLVSHDVSHDIHSNSREWERHAFILALSHFFWFRPSANIFNVPSWPFWHLFTTLF